ncbi:MAG: DNA repair exonuclease [Planctomycetes bacterium]|nr:DNA repair exonuclease [Planctomycetota bacterium]
MVRFIHTADWQVGKPYSRVADPACWALLRQERIAVIGRIGEVARDRKAQFVLVAGDLFDTSSPDRRTVSAACRAIGSIGVPVLAIPGNHDHGGVGGIWEQEFFLAEQKSLAPNLRLLSVPSPLELESAVILPCPLSRRHESNDVTGWLYGAAVLGGLPPAKPRIVLAHGSVQGFSSASDEESEIQSNRIDLGRLSTLHCDYIALGDWHGTKQVADRAWYSGTPELDRFMKGSGHDPGNVLCVEIAEPGQMPRVTSVRTSRLAWHDEQFHLVDDGSLDHLDQRLMEVLGDRVQADLLQLTLDGKLGFAGDRRLKGILERLEARLLRLSLENRVQVVPGDAEIAELTHRAGDPLVAEVAERLVREHRAGGEKAETALRALRELYVGVMQGGLVA